MISRIVAFFLLIILSPIFILTSLFILAEDGLPIFFKQKRVGINKNIFLIWKFRSMKNFTPNVPKEKLEEPSCYHLKFGVFIRDFSIDELPNLINIVKGEMNFIGPRPALFNEYELIEKRDNYGINSIRPGLTGWAQVNGRDNLTNEFKLGFDKEYLDNKSFLFDVKIFFLSFRAVAKPINIWFIRNYLK